MKPLLFLPLLLVPAVPALRAALPGHTASSPRPAQAPEAGLAWGDVDGDGLDDVLVVDAGARARLLMHFGEGRFEDVTAACGLGEQPLASCALLTDLDGDGHEDLYLGSSETRLWRNLGNGTFEPLASGIDHDLVDLSVQAIDRDEDGRPDLEIHTEAGDLVYRNLGRGRFERLELPLGVAAPLPPRHVGQIAPEAAGSADPLTPDAGTPAQRRLDRWTRGRVLGGFASPTSGTSAATSALTAPDLPFLATCQPGVRDAVGGACLGASSVPEMGKLYPLNDKFWIDPTTRFVSIGGASPTWPMTLLAEGDGYTQWNTTENIVVGSFARDGMGWYGTYSNHPLGFFVNYAELPSMTIDTTGNVGIGTETPDSRLEIEDPTGTASLHLDGSFANAYLDRASSGQDSTVRFQTAGVDDWIIGTDNAPAANADDFSIKRTPNGAPDLSIDDVTGEVTMSHDVNLRSSAGDLNLVIESDTDHDNQNDHAGIQLLQDGGFTRSYIGYASSENHLKIVTQEPGMDIILNAGGSDAAGAGLYDLKIVNATGLVSVKNSLEIRGGADIVEHFESSCGTLEPGTVVVIDPENPGQLSCSFDAYDSKVAGVVSGAGGVKPGLCLGQDGMLEGETPVAMTGRVYVKCSTENGAIRPGDRLTTASLAGHAMKVTDTTRADGAVIGKAMSSLDEGTGLVLVLVNLQ